MAYATLTSVAANGLSPSGAAFVTGAAWFLPFLLTAIAYYQSLLNDAEKHPIDAKNLYLEYDFIIVGGGSAGAVLANRLTENSSWKVLLLEAGGNENIFSDVPIFAGSLQLTELDWQYKTEPQPGRACLGHTDGRCNFPRGKVMGGSSTLNYMLYVRGNRHDYDGWAAFGNPGWSYEDVLPYFIKSEDNRNPYLTSTEYHGTGGYLTVQEAPWRSPLATAYLEAGVEMGFQNRDCNGEFQTGFMIPQGTIRRGSRCSTSKAFLRPVRLRKNLHIAMHSFVTKILIDPITKSAYGVRFRRNGKVYEIRAKKEVILSAGAINTPQLLMLSGIGPRRQLKQLGIPVLQDLPVGELLFDHYGTGALVFQLEKPVALVPNRYENLPSMLKYAVFGSGPLTVLGGVEALAFIPTKFVNASIDYPDIELHIASGSIASDGGKTFMKTHGVGEEMWKAFEPLAFKDTWSIVPMLMRPKSTGSVKLRSKNPFHKPILNAGYFSHPDDIKVLVEGVKFALAMAETQALKKFGAKFWDEVPLPGCANLTLWTDDYWACCCRQYTATIYHYSGTAKMGPATDVQSVVNHELKVFGIRGLRVVDASIFPSIPSGNINAPVIMVAEKASDMIKHFWHSMPQQGTIGNSKSYKFFDWPQKAAGHKVKP